MKIYKYQEYSISLNLFNDFLNVIGKSLINESGKISYKPIIKKLIDDLKLNTSLILTFGTGLTAMYPIVESLIKNMNLKVELTPENIVLMTISGITIAYLEEIKENKEKKKLELDSKTMLEELKLKGIGNGIIKKLVSCIKSIGNIFKILFKNKRHVINGFFDLFGYTSISIPILNAILYMVNKHNMSLDDLPSNFLSLGMGITTFAAKHGLNYLIDLLKSKLNLDKKDIFNNLNDVDDPILKKYPHPEYIDTDYNNTSKEKLIKEKK